MNNKANKTSFKKGHAGLTGEKNPMWKGDKVGYTALHQWLYLHFGKPKKCDQCGTENAKKFEWANISKKYKRDRTDWMRLCASCHDIYDELGKKVWAKRKQAYA